MRFPQKGTCLAIYSRCVNAQEPIEEALRTHFPWCSDYPEQLKQLFRAYTERKQRDNTLDYDDLLLYWYHLMQDEALAADVRERFDAVLVDEYQDTNALQAAILQGLCAGRARADGRRRRRAEHLLVPGRDGAQHPRLPDARSRRDASLKLEQNYRSVQPILDATNAVIALSPAAVQQGPVLDPRQRGRSRGS